MITQTNLIAYYCTLCVTHHAPLPQERKRARFVEATAVGMVERITGVLEVAALSIDLQNAAHSVRYSNPAAAVHECLPQWKKLGAKVGGRVVELGDCLEKAQLKGDQLLGNIERMAAALDQHHVHAHALRRTVDDLEDERTGLHSRHARTLAEKHARISSQEEDLSERLDRLERAEKGEREGLAAVARGERALERLQRRYAKKDSEAAALRVFATGQATRYSAFVNELMTKR